MEKINKFENIAGVFILFLAFIYSALSFMGYYGSHGYYFFDPYVKYLPINSDSVQLATMFKDLILGDGKWSDWYFSAAPYFFPDMLIWFVLNSMIPSFYYTFISYFLIQQLLLFIFIYYLAKEFITQKALIISSIIFIFVLHYSIMHIYAFLPVFHFSEFIFGIFWLVLAIKILKTKSYIYTLFFVLLGVLLKLSDNIFVIHFMLPFVCALIFLRLMSYVSIKEFFTFLVLLAISYIFGSILYDIIIPINTQCGMEFSLKAFLNNIDKLIDIFTKTKKITLFSIIFIFSIFAFILIILFNDKIKNKLNSSNLLLMLFSIFSCGGIVVFTAHDFLPVGERYYYSIVCVTVIISLILILPYFKKFTLFILLLVAILAPNYKIFKDFNLNLTYSTKLSKCVDDLTAKYNAKHGVSEYWQAKILFALSDVKMAQVINNLESHFSVTSKNFFKDKYDFAIINNKPTQPEYVPDKAKIIKINGQPDELITCDNSEILYYKNGLYLDELLGTGKISFDFKDLHTQVGKKNDEIIVAKGAKGFASFGPFIKLKAGKYSFELVYSSNNSDEQNGWDVAINSGQNILASGELKDTNDKFEIVSGNFELNSDSKVEIRTIYSGKGELKIKELIIYKDKK